MSYLPLRPSSIFFISDIVFNSKNLIWVFKKISSMFLLNFLTIWTTVTVFLIFWCANSNLCQLWAGLNQLLFFPSMVCIFLVFTCLIIFPWTPDFVNITVLSTEYFCISTSTLELCSGTQLNYFEIVCSFCVLLLGYAKLA